MKDNNIERAIEANQEYENSVDRQLEKDIDENFEGLKELIKDDDLFIWYKALIKELCLDYGLKTSLIELKNLKVPEFDFTFQTLRPVKDGALLRQDVRNRIKELESKIL